MTAAVSRWFADGRASAGWNFSKAGFAQGELCENNGSMFPFATLGRSGSRTTIRVCRWLSAIQRMAIVLRLFRRPRSNSSKIDLC